MVVNIDADRLSDDRAAGGVGAKRRKPQGKRAGCAGEALTIGLVNNMAGTAFKATERQFVSLLNSASEGIPIHLSFYTLPGLSRTEAGGSHFASHYAGVEALMDTHLDGLIVTGREPKMASLRDEPYWESFTQVLEWARTNTHSTVWSCLAAHGAVLHMDGIERRRSAEKNFGIFDCARIAEHPLAEGVSERFHVPHSRWNGIAKEDLTAHGYAVLSSIDGDGVDTFVKDEESLFVFFQGHLEYETDTLMREYRRDVGRYVKGEMDSYPLLPRGYFNRDTESVLTALRDKAAAKRSTELLTKVAAALEETTIENTWRDSAARIYKNWLEHLVARKSADEQHLSVAI